ncbi:MAG: cupin domain-containing protein [Acidobacteriales bacterium]|nr:cupin domain-containing protein [Terriglobales bacterium]
MSRYRFPVSEGLTQLPTPDGKRFATLFRHGTMILEVYAPRGTDPQQPHQQDELYFVVSGSGAFVVNEQRLSFGVGDSLFVPAGAVHRFEDFTDDLAVWVVFWGPPGGEK